MFQDVTIEQATSIGDKMGELSDLLIQVVADGASIGFLPPLSVPNAQRYWENVISPEVILLVAKRNNEIVGSVQVHLCSKQNGAHRAEIAKLMTHPLHRRGGIGRSLMHKAEQFARQEGRMLIVLDTREGDASNLLYHSLGYIEVGRIPDYAKSASGELDATVIYYKILS